MAGGAWGESEGAAAQAPALGAAGGSQRALQPGTAKGIQGICAPEPTLPAGLPIRAPG